MAGFSVCFVQNRFLTDRESCYAVSRMVAWLKLLGGQESEALRCSFCEKTQAAAGKLFSAPSDYPRAYICDECVTVCASILDKMPQLGVPEVGVLKAETDESHALLNHPLTPQLRAAIERWIREESLGANAAEAFAQVRAAGSGPSPVGAIRWMRPGTEK